MNLKEKVFKAKKLNEVICAKFDPEGAGHINICLIPARFSLKSKSSIVTLNSRNIIPLAPAWTVLFSNFLFELKKIDEEIDEKTLNKIVDDSVMETKKIYPTVKSEELKADLEKIITVLKDDIAGKKSKVNIGQLDLIQFSKFMKGPLKANLILTPFVSSGSRLNNASCIYSSTKLEELHDFKPLSLNEYKKIINILRKNCVPRIVFNGDNILDRKEDLLELLSYCKKDFSTSIKTKGRRLTKELCEKFAKRGLDELSVTLYSHDKQIHNLLSNENSFDKIIEGIKNAREAGINVIVDTPICTVNKDYLETLKLIKSLGVRYTTCRLLNVKKCLTRTKEMNVLTKDEVIEVFDSIKEYIAENKIEVLFATHSYLPVSKLKEYGVGYTLCRACVNEITINVFGDVIPCYNCIDTKKILGNILKDDWKKIWQGELTQKIRKEALSDKVKCPSNRVKE